MCAKQRGRERKAVHKEGRREGEEGGQSDRHHEEGTGEERERVAVRVRVGKSARRMKKRRTGLIRRQRGCGEEWE